MSTEDSAEKIRRRMAELRRDLDVDVREVERGARVMTDWKFYARKFPWAVAGTAEAPRWAPRPADCSLARVP